MQYAAVFAKPIHESNTKWDHNKGTEPAIIAEAMMNRVHLSQLVNFAGTKIQASATEAIAIRRPPADARV